ncbi:unnamed protein product [Meloidogyne enterolobii]|uniref:Uncharacterized protein n=1 Tax=Meloidogyne enterolobii TaxID=390850 RepID=A0ACB0YF27_MELEN
MYRQRHLSIEILNPLFLAHFSIIKRDSISLFLLLSLLCSTYSLISSAYILTLTPLGRCSGKSLINITNNKGPSTLP